MRQGLLLPLLYGMEFVAIFSLYLLFFRRREGLGKGEVKRSDFALLLFALLVIQFIFPRLMGVENGNLGDGAGGIARRDFGAQCRFVGFRRPRL